MGLEEQEEDRVGTWEPWKPKLGDRVRVHLSAECRQEWPPSSDYPDHPKITGHIWEHDGIVGTVKLIASPDSPFHHHPYAVMFDQEQRCLYHDGSCLYPILGEWLAASEIIPLEEDR